MESLFLTTVRIFLWKHWKCFHHSWIKNTFMIIVPIAIAWFQIHVSSGHTNGVQRIFDPIREVRIYHSIDSITNPITDHPFEYVVVFGFCFIVLRCVQVSSAMEHVIEFSFVLHSPNGTQNKFYVYVFIRMNSAHSTHIQRNQSEELIVYQLWCVGLRSCGVGRSQVSHSKLSSQLRVCAIACEHERRTIRHSLHFNL